MGQKKNLKHLLDVSLECLFLSFLLDKTSGEYIRKKKVGTKGLVSQVNFHDSTFQRRSRNISFPGSVMKGSEKIKKKKKVFLQPSMS